MDLGLQAAAGFLKAVHLIARKLHTLPTLILSYIKTGYPPPRLTTSWLIETGPAEGRSGGSTVVGVGTREHI